MIVSNCLYKRKNLIIISIKYHYIENISYFFIINEIIKSNIIIINNNIKLIKLLKFIENLNFIKYLAFLNIITHSEKIA